MKRLFLALAALFLLAGCSAVNANKKNPSTFYQQEKPYKSVVQIKNSISFEKCEITEEGEIGECEKASQDFAVGSGFAIGESGEYQTKHIGTAGHLCKLSEMQKARMRLRGLFTGVYLKNIKLHSFKVISDEEDEFDSKRIKVDRKLDACLLNVEGRSFPALEMAKKGPKRGKRYFSMGAPLGITDYLTSGLYSGPKEFRGQEWQMYSMPSAGGSSGSAILNKEGEIVGIISLGVPRFKEVSISPKFAKLHFFFTEGID